MRTLPMDSRPCRYCTSLWKRCLALFQRFGALLHRFGALFKRFGALLKMLTSFSKNVIALLKWMSAFAKEPLSSLLNVKERFHVCIFKRAPFISFENEKGSFENADIFFKGCNLSFENEVCTFKRAQWQFPQKMLLPRNPPNPETDIPQYKFVLNQNLDLNLYRKMPRN